MRSIRNLVPMKLLLLLLLSVCWTVGVANAQSTGKFRLQHEVHWGQAVLPAGEYSFTIDSTKDNTPLVVVRSADGKKAAFALATAASIPEPGGSYIYVANDGTRRVRLLNLPEANLSLAFGPMSKRDREELHAAKAEVVPVVVAKK
jgi:hypothetical protein